MLAYRPPTWLQSAAGSPLGRGNSPADTMTNIFSDIIEDHLRLRERNAPLEPVMPLDRYKGIDPFENHPLFKTEEQARIEDTLDGGVSIVDLDEHLVAVQAHGYEAPAGDQGLWSRSRDFDWGD